MPAVADVVRRHAPAYLERFGEAVPRPHRKVLGAISDCRTGRLGTVVFACKNCERRHQIGRSCGNRHCPGCQHDKGTAWLDRQTSRLLPCPYFLLTFTLPAELRPVARAHQRTVYDAFFRASSDAIKALAADPLFTPVDPAVWTKDWVVDIQAVGDGRTAIRYLAPYIFRVAISDHRIHACDDHNVTFTWRKSGSRRPRSLRLEAHEFLRRFLQHVLPRGFQKVRYYGFLSPNASNSLDRARWLATLHARETFVLEPAHGAPPRLPPRQRCAHCGGSLRVLRVLRFRGTARFDSS